MDTNGILLSNGMIVDGLGKPPRIADLLIRGNRIVDIGKIPFSSEWEILRCDGLYVVPGFIDIHSHSDKETLQHLPNKILQGITTEVVGNCGFSLFPSRPNPQGIRYTGEIFDGEPEGGMNSTRDYFSALQSRGTRVNVAALTGHVALRIFAMKMEREASSDQMGEMEKALDLCLSEGSVGFSTGLNCMPSSFADREEIVRLCGRLGSHEGIYATHMRDYKFKILEALDEAVTVGREANVPVQVSHMQVVGKKNWAKLDSALELIDRSVREGIDVGMDAYPYLAGCCSLIQFLPDWCKSGGVSSLLQQLSSASARSRIVSETDAYMSNTWDDLVIAEVRTPGNRSKIGKSIAKIAEEVGNRPEEAAINLLLEEEGNVYVISFNSNEENLRKVLTHPLTSIITDGFVMEGASHPRTFGTYPKFLGEYVRDKRWMPMEEAIKKTSTLAARRFRLRDRGSLRPGNFADITVFSGDRIGSDADYSHPACDPRGIHHVLVNGKFGVRDGKLTDEAAGMCLRNHE